MITSLIILLPVLVGLLLWHQLPEQIPVHFNSEGVADSYQSKLWGVTFIYLVIFACHWFAAIITSVDPRRRNISSKIYRLVLWICPVISVFVGVMIYGTALNWPWVNINFMANLLLGVIFIVIGNYLPKCRQNYTVGIKVPWTLASEANWDATHRMAGKLWVAGGVLILLLAIQPWIPAFPISLVLILAVTFIPMIYSFVYYLRNEK